MYGDLQTTLAIQNFRRELTGIVYPLSQVTPIDNVTEKLTDPVTFNKRFTQLGEAVKHCFNAAGDIAIRDKRYLETFFSGYTNPVVTKHYSYSNATQHYATNNWDYNGVPITFTENMVEYNVDATGKLDFTSCYVWVFKNGLLLDSDLYSIVNTAYGVKCYIKATSVSDNDEVSIVVNRIFNNSAKYVITKAKATANTQASILLPISSFGTFYHDKYITIYVKRNYTDLSGNTDFYFKLIPRDVYETAINVTGDTLKIDINGFDLKKDEELFVFNSVYYWNYEKISKDGSGWTNEIDLMIKDTSNITRPIPFCSIEDFDIFFNGFHLTPGLHFTLIKGGNELVPYRIKLLFNQKDTNAPFSLKIWHNEAVVDDKDCIIIRNGTMQNQGLLTSKSPDLIPLMPRLGHMWLSDKYINNDYLRSRHRQVMSADATKTNVVSSLTNAEYKLRIVQTTGLQAVLNFVVDNYSEFDIVGEWIGLDNLVSTIYAKLPNVVLDSTNKTVIATFNGNKWEFYDTETAAVEQFRVILEYYQNNNVSRPVILDANYAADATGYPMSVIGQILVLDSNMKQSEALVLDTNSFFNA